MRRRLFLGALGLVVAACGAQSSTIAGKPAPTPPAVVPSASASASAATGSALALQLGKTKLTPIVSDSWQARDVLSLDKEGKLYVGASGQRWLVREEPAPLPDDPEHTRYVLTGAPMMAPETLVAVRRKPDGAFLFVGESGATYRAKTALGDLGDARKPPEPLRAVTVGKDAIVAITARDMVVRSTDDGASFGAVALPKTRAVPLALVGNARGNLAMLAVPGKLLASLDDGLTFQVVQTNGFGPTTLVRSEDDGTLFLRGTTVSATKPPGLASFTTANAILGTSGGAPTLMATKKGPVNVSRPSNDEDRLQFGEAIGSGRAVLHDLRYLEVQPDTNESAGLTALVLDQGKTTSAPIAGTNDCELAGVANAGSAVVMMCTRSVTASGATRDELHYFRSADFGKTFVRDATALPAADNQKVLALSSKGTIFTVAACAAGPACEGLLYKPTGAKSFAKCGVPAGYTVSKVLPAPDGDRIFAFAAHPEDGTNALLVSRDGGKTFAAKPTPDGADDNAQLAYDETTGTFAMFATGKPLIRYATRDDGATWDTRELPIDADWVSLAGPRGLATDDDAVGYETLDFGATWTRVPIPPSAAVGGTLPVACSAKGCLLGDVALREGWELKSAADVKPVTRAAAGPPKLAHLPPMECAAEGDELDVGTLGEPKLDPSAGVSFAALSDGANGAIDVVTWPRGGKALTRVSLLAAPKEPSGVRRWQTDDGAIVMRALRGDGKGTSDVEVAWWVSSSNKVFRGTLAKATASLGKWGTPSGVAAIVPGVGLYVRPGNSTEPTLYLVKEGSAVSKVAINSAFPSWPRLYARRTAKGTLFAGPSHELRVGDRVAVFALLADGGAMTTHAWSLWPRGSVRADLSFGGDQLVVSTPGNATLTPRAWAVGWLDGALDPPEPRELPLGKQLLEAPSCASQSARVELPWTPGYRTPYTVKQAKRTTHLATHATVARVGDKTCVRGVVAAAPNATSPGEWLLLPSDDPGRGFLLTRSGKAHVLTRVTCQKSAAPLPSTFNTAKGFVEDRP